MAAVDAGGGQAVNDAACSADGISLADALETKARLEAILWNAMDAIVTIDEAQHIIFFNPAAEAMFGIANADVLGESIDRFIPARFRHGHAAHIRQFSSAGTTGREMGALGQLSGLRADGSEFPIEASISQAVVGKQHFSTVILRDITERLANEEVRTLLAREVDHRAKNALALVQALVTLTRAPTHDAFVEAVEGRVAAIARAQSLLARNQWHGGNLEQIVREEVAAYAGPDRVMCDGPKLVLSPRAVQPVGLLIHELATNALKYGALSTTPGRVNVRWVVSPSGELELCWRESGGPLVHPPRHKGFGSTLISTVTAQQLSGVVTVDYATTGVVAIASLPADVIKQPVVAAVRNASDPDSDGFCPRGRMLVVEDEVLIAMQMAEILADAGWTVLGPATSMEQALELLDSEGMPDAAVLDVNLNGEIVGALAQRLRDADVPVLLCTGYESIEDERFSRCALIRKPANVRQLIAGIERAVKTHRDKPDDQTPDR